MSLRRNCDWEQECQPNNSIAAGSIIMMIIITTFLFQRLSMALQRGNAVSFNNTMVTE